MFRIFSVVACDDALISGSAHYIPDHALTTSVTAAIFLESAPARLSRLNTQSDGNHVGTWASAGGNDVWLQVNDCYIFWWKRIFLFLFKGPLTYTYTYTYTNIKANVFLKSIIHSKSGKKAKTWVAGWCSVMTKRD